ncbi:uncharacterized protein LOC141719112 [Apium graveolens]|uniref:uncharacterized protein LOC141719112 n=1 Tax=Apium graveolens TaxID=4045 RepID=UPI003D78DFEA
MDVISKVGVRTRAEALGMEKDSSAQMMKRRKVEAEELALSSSSLTQEPSNIGTISNQACISQGNAKAAENESKFSNFGSDSSASCCSSNELSAEATTDHKLNSADLEESVAAEALSSNEYNTRECGETTPLNQQAGQTLQPESTSVVTSSYHQITTEKFMPSESELEEFLAVAEKNVRKQFIEKYNYDISKDEPLSGRYEWIKLKP